MDAQTLILFVLAVVPLICTPGPDILFAISQGLAAGRRGALRAVGGVLIGYSAHALLAAVGIAALVAASPLLFTIVKWLGVAYISWLAYRMLRSAWERRGDLEVVATPPVSLWRGFFTSFLNPKGILMYVAVLPQFVDPTQAVAPQTLLLSAVFIGLCGLIYCVVGLAAARSAGKALRDAVRRRIEAIAGGLLVGAAAKMAGA